MIMYMFLSLLATIATEGLIFMGIYLYETEIIAGEYKKVWGASGQGKMSLGTFTMSQSVALDAWVIVIFTILLLVIYFILISNKFVMYVREIISGVERMKSGDLMEEIPVQERMSSQKSLLRLMRCGRTCMKRWNPRKR